MNAVAFSQDGEMTGLKITDHGVAAHRRRVRLALS